MRKGALTILIFTLCLLVSSCGTTQLIVSGQKDVDIYANGQYVGKDIASITRTGTPRKLTVQARYNSQIIGQTTVKRKFTVTTFLVGYITYGVGFIFAWKYPETVFIPVTNSAQIPDNNQSTISPWDKPMIESVWDKPINH